MAIVRRRDEIYPALAQKLLRNHLFLRLVRIVHGDRMAAEHADYFHAWHIGLSVADIYHLRERDTLLVLRHALIHLLGIPCTENALVYLEDELRLGSVVDRDSRPLRLAFLVIDEGTGENMLELLGYRAALDNLFQAGRIDVVLHLHAM